MGLMVSQGEERQFSEALMRLLGSRGDGSSFLAGYGSWCLNAAF